jgi:malate dehydrogenase (oxaloacetate-decarboxylating)(NADP+)
MNGLMLPGRRCSWSTPTSTTTPAAEQLAEITVLAAEEMLRFGIQPKAALLSHSNFGTSNQPVAVKMRDALALLRQQAPWLEVDGEMHGDVALDASYRRNADAAQHAAGRGQPAGAAQHRRRQHRLQPAQDGAGGGIAIGPVLLGAAKPVHILTPSATVRRIVNMTALTVADANGRPGRCAQGAARPGPANACAGAVRWSLPLRQGRHGVRQSRAPAAPPATWPLS